MLDIYLVPSSCSTMPKDPRGLVHAGSIDFDAHRSLAVVFDQCGQAGAKLSYFDDSLLRPEQVVTMRRVFDAHTSALGANRGQIAAFNAIRGVLDRAAEQGMGLAAFCD
ncbi:hypothetical protein QMO14_17430 [Variovorax sp. CAN2819]|jgi:hypothetical protein|uniref:hypothetical protein n=1 Tax=Variovorax sp. CAN15 TaxID=3046727 RepID=UPI0026470EF5|nr:hypothetical protein [Variovorax sp. CAN15]MDN6885379.1 hypothetical protein [Variovorax sp. CAN15]